jgi:NADPH2:quinone reductase
LDVIPSLTTDANSSRPPGDSRGARAEIDLFEVMRKRLTVTGSLLRPRPVTEKARIAASLCGTVWPWLAAGRVKPVVHRVLPLTAAADAHRIMEGGEHIGKLVLQVAAR